MDKLFTPFQWLFYLTLNVYELFYYVAYMSRLRVNIFKRKVDFLKIQNSNVRYEKTTFLPLLPKNLAAINFQALVLISPKTSILYPPKKMSPHITAYPKKENN